MAISTNGTVLARLAGALYNTQMSNATYKEVASLDPAALANTLYARDFSSSTDLAVATTLVTNLGLSSITGLNNWVAAQLTAAGSAKGAKVVDLLNSFAQMTADTTYGAYATAFNTKVDAALALSQTTDNKGGTFAAAGTVTAANATFALTTGTDVWTGGAGDDTISATVATLGALDVIDGGAGNDTLNIVDTAAVASLGSATFSGIETVKVSSGGAVGAVAAAAGTTTAAVAQALAIKLGGTWASGDKIAVTVGDSTIETAVASPYAAADAVAALTTSLNAILGDAITVGSAVNNSSVSGYTLQTVIPVTAKAVGNSLPAISFAVTSSSATKPTVGLVSTSVATATTTDAVATVTAPTIGTAPVAIKQSAIITIADSGTNTAVGTISLIVNGTEYTRAGTGATPAAAATDIAGLINSVLGTGSAVADTTAKTVTVSALAAGTALPALNLKLSGYATGGGLSDSWNYSIGNTAANAVATSAATIAAPTGTTSYVVSATGVANVSGATTTALDVTGTAVQTSSGSSVKVTASDSVYVASAKGAVTVSTGTTGTKLIGAVAADTATGTAGDAAGVYVTGGTTVTITGSKTTGDVKVGAAPYAKNAVSATSNYPQTNGNVAKTPTGDVSITKVSASTSSTTGAVTGTYGIGTNTVYTNGATTVTSKGAASTVITDTGTLSLQASDTAPSAPGTSKLATVNLAGLSGTATIKSDAINTVNLSDTLTAQTVTISNSGALGANSGVINFNVSNVGTSSVRVTLDDATATSVNVGSLAATSYNSVATGTATAVASNSGSKGYITLLTPAATKVTLTNSLSLDVGNVATNAAKVATVDASGATGSIAATIGSATTVGMVFTGGSGADTVTLTGDPSVTATTKVTTVALGAGNDSLLNSTSSAVSSTNFTGASFDGGDGNDTVAISLLTVGNSTKFINFETLGLDIASAGTADVSILGGITGYKLLANSTGTVTYQNAIAGNGLSIGGTAGVTNASGVTALDFGTTVSGSADAYAITFNGTGSSTSTLANPTTIQAGVIKVTGIEALSIVSGGTSYTNNTIALDDANARTLTISGAQKATVTFASGFGGTTATSAADPTGLDSIDATTTTGGTSINTSNVALSYRAANSGLTVNTGSGSDAITLAQLAVVNAGAGDDAITSSNAGGVFTGGTGVNTYNVALAVGTSPIVTITDLKSKDVIDLAGTIAAAGTLGTKADVSAATSLASALEIANGASGTVSTTALSWFQYGGNTYVYADVPASGPISGTLDATDNIVKIIGLIDLTGSAYTTGATITIV